MKKATNYNDFAVVISSGDDSIQLQPRSTVLVPDNTVSKVAGIVFGEIEGKSPVKKEK